MDEFGHTHSEDYLAVTVWYDAQEQLRTLAMGEGARLDEVALSPASGHTLGGVFIRGHTQGRWVLDERDVSQQIKRAGEEGARRND